MKKLAAPFFLLALSFSYSLLSSAPLWALQDEPSPCRCYKVVDPKNQEGGQESKLKTDQPDCWINTTNCGRESKVENRWKVGNDFVWCGTPDFQKKVNQKDSKIPECQDTEKGTEKKAP